MTAPSRCILVTGAGQGIGKAIAARFVDQGDRVVLAERDAEAGVETAAELAARGEVRFVHTDVADETQVRRAVQEAVAWTGRLDVLVNNAGIMVERPLEQLGLDDWQRVIGTNLTGAFLCAREAAPHLRQSRGVIVQIGSTRAHMSEPHTEAYAASKGGLVALTHALAASLAPDVRVHCVSPGWIDVSGWQKTRARQPAVLRPDDHAQHWTGRVGRPEDVAALVAFLASGEAGFLTGEEIAIDGGMTRKMLYV